MSKLTLSRSHLVLAIGLSFALVVAACSSDEADTAAPPSSAGEPAEDASEPSTEPEPAAEESNEDPSGSATASTPADEPTEEAETDEPEPVESIFPLTIVDAAGTEFTFEEPPRLGCAWYGCVETAAAVGVDLYASIVTPDENAQPFYGSGNTEVFITDFQNPEEWAAAGVDLILTSVNAAGSPGIEAMEQAAPVFYLYYDNFIGPPAEIGGQTSYLLNLEFLAQLGDNVDAAARATAEYQAMLTTMSSLATDATAAQTISVLFALDGYATLGPVSAFCSLLQETGHGTCVGEGVGALMNAEAYLGLDPDLIIHTAFGGENTIANREANDPIWNQLSAVQSGNVYETESSRFYCCSTSAQIMMAQEYVGLLFPDAGIPRPDIGNFDPSQSPLVVGG